jgi:transposase
MGNRRISPQVKELALELWMRGFSRSDVCQIFQVSPRSLYRWRKLLDEFDSVTPPPSPLRGRPRIIGLAVMTAVRQLYEQHPDTYLDELQWYLAVHHDTAISISSLQRNLDKAGLTRKMLHKIAIEQDEQLRANFRTTIRDREHFSGTGMEFVTVDESSKDERTYARRYGRALIGHTPDISDVFVRGERYSLVAAMSIEGYLATRVTEGSFNMQSFFSFIIDDLVSWFSPTFSDVCALICTQGSSDEPVSREAQRPCSRQL